MNRLTGLPDNMLSTVVGGVVTTGKTPIEYIINVDTKTGKVLLRFTQSFAPTQLEDKTLLALLRSKGAYYVVVQVSL